MSPVAVCAEEEDAALGAELHDLVVRVAVGVVEPAARDGVLGRGEVEYFRVGRGARAVVAELEHVAVEVVAADIGAVGERGRRRCRP